MQRTIQTGSFQCTSARGTEFTVYIYTNMFDDVIVSTPRLETEEGHRVRRLSKGQYQIEFGQDDIEPVDVSTTDPIAP